MPHIVDYTARLGFENVTAIVGDASVLCAFDQKQLKSLLLIGARC
jgi:hypothetical protein